MTGGSGGSGEAGTGGNGSGFTAGGPGTGGSGAGPAAEQSGGGGGGGYFGGGGGGGGHGATNDGGAGGGGGTDFCTNTSTISGCAVSSGAGTGTAAGGAAGDARVILTYTVASPPTVSIATPSNGASYTQGQIVHSGFACSEGAGGSGIASCTDQAVRSSGAAIDTSTVGPHTFTVLATSQDGLIAASTVSYSVLPTKATISSLSETNKTFSAAKRSTPLTGHTARRHKQGTVFSFRLDQPATVKIAIQTSRPGRRVGRRCKPDSKRLRGKRRCIRTVTIVTLVRSGHAGINKVAFSGRVRGKALRPGRYQAVFTAVDAAGSSQPRRLRFTIVKR